MGRRRRPRRGDDPDDPGDGDYVALPASAGRGGGRRWGLALLGLLVVIVLVVGAGAVWVKGQVDPRATRATRSPSPSPPGAPTSEIADAARRQGHHHQRHRLRVVAEVQRGRHLPGRRLRRLRQNSSMSEVTTVLDAGPGARPKPVVRSWCARACGSPRRRQLDPRHASRAWTRAALDAARRHHPPAAPAPGRVDEPRGLPVPGHLRGAAERARRPAGADRPDDGRLRPDAPTEAGLADAAARPPRARPARSRSRPTRRSIVASLIEAEAKVPADRPKIARVIYNRLAQGMPLGIDTTVALPALQDRKARRSTESAARHRLALQHPEVRRPAARRRSTRPGRPSLEAALDPARRATGSTTCSPTRTAATASATTSTTTSTVT